MGRHKVEDRSYISKTNREFVNARNGCRCARCGKNLVVGGNFTLEHIIPISLGGTNKPENLIGLCKTCNDLKADKVMYATWYSHANEDLIEDIHSLVGDYLRSVDWVSKNDFLGVDEINCYLFKNLKTGAIGTHLDKGYRKVKYSMSRATYADMNDIYNSYLKYNSKWGIDLDKSDLKNKLSDYFDNGGIYLFRNTSKEVVCILTVKFNKVDDDIIILGFDYPICIYDRYEYYVLLAGCLQEIVSRLHYGLQCVSIPLTITYVDTNPYMRIVASILGVDILKQDDDISALSYISKLPEVINEENITKKDYINTIELAYDSHKEWDEIDVGSQRDFTVDEIYSFFKNTLENRGICL